MTEQIRTARCYCGGVEVTVQGAPAIQGYCHCTSCRRWSTQPFIAYALWPSDKVRVTKGAELMRSIPRNETLDNHFCTTCGGHLMSVSAAAGFSDVFPMGIEGFDFQPTAHVNYGERVIDMPDGLPKYRDMPERAGGSGVLIDE